MNDAAENACLSVIADGMADAVSVLPGVDMSVLGAALLPVPDRILVAASLHVLPPTGGANLLSGPCLDPAAPTAVNDAGMVRVHLPVPGLSMLSAMAYADDEPRMPRMYVFVMTRGVDATNTVQVVRFAADDECLDFVDSPDFTRWALSAT